MSNNNMGKEVINFKQGALPRREKTAEIIYLVLAIKKDDDEEEPSQLNEVIPNMRDLYDFLVDNFEVLDLENTRIFSSSPDINKEGLIDLRVYKSAYDMLKYLEGIYVHENFKVDDEIQENVFYQESTLDQ